MVSIPCVCSLVRGCRRAASDQGPRSRPQGPSFRMTALGPEGSGAVWDQRAGGRVFPVAPGLRVWIDVLERLIQGVGLRLRHLQRGLEDGSEAVQRVPSQVLHPLLGAPPLPARDPFRIVENCEGELSKPGEGANRPLVFHGSLPVSAGDR